MVNENVLGSWKDSGSKEAILDFVRSVTEQGGPHFVSRRIASRRSITTEPSGARSRCRSSSTSSCDASYAMVEAQPELRDRQPWKAAHERDCAWLGDVVAKY